MHFWLFVCHSPARLVWQPGCLGTESQRNKRLLNLPCILMESTTALRVSENDVRSDLSRSTVPGTIVRAVCDYAFVRRSFVSSPSHSFPPSLGYAINLQPKYPVVVTQYPAWRTCACAAAVERRKEGRKEGGEREGGGPMGKVLCRGTKRPTACLPASARTHWRCGLRCDVNECVRV